MYDIFTGYIGAGAICSLCGTGTQLSDFYYGERGVPTRRIFLKRETVQICSHLVQAAHLPALGNGAQSGILKLMREEICGVGVKARWLLAGRFGEDGVEIHEPGLE